MYIVGLISKYEVLKTYIYSGLEEARKELKSWEKIFRTNNNVEYSTTITERDILGNVIKVKTIFKVVDDSTYIMFLSKGIDYRK